MSEKQDYFRWLVELCNGDGRVWLLKKLYEKEFYTFIPNDENREEDGKTLRDIYNTEKGYTALSIWSPCSVLEAVIGISIRIEGILDGSSSEKRKDEIFWELLGNLGLSNFTDDEYDLRADDAIEEAIINWMDRKYKPNGKGGIFPLKKPKEDQTEVEIWYQLHQYLAENYQI